MKTKIQRPVKNECDKQIETRSRSHALDFVAAAAQILTILCIVKGNPAWKGSLSLLFFGGAAALVYKYDEYKEKNIFHHWNRTGYHWNSPAYLVWNYRIKELFSAYPQQRL